MLNVVQESKLKINQTKFSTLPAVENEQENPASNRLTGTLVLIVIWITS